MNRIEPVKKELSVRIREKINKKTKPLGALGKLEELAHQICLIQGTLEPELNHPQIIVFAGDHGIAREGVSLYPQEVTYQMVYNFANGGAAINVFCRQSGIKLTVVDAGVNFDFPEETPIRHSKIKKSTSSFLHGNAMIANDCLEAIKKGEGLASEAFASGTNVIGFGEMGIGNTSSAAVIVSILANLPLELCTGRGTGLMDNQLNHKIAVLNKALSFHSPLSREPLSVLQIFGGYEIAMMVGAMLKAAEKKMTLLIDGFIASSALLVAFKMNSAVLDYCIFCHLSEEKGHKMLLEYLNVEPILNMGMRLGEGTGAAIAYPIVKSAVAFVNEMASFESAGVAEGVKV